MIYGLSPQSPSHITVDWQPAVLMGLVLVVVVLVASEVMKPVMTPQVVAVELSAVFKGVALAVMVVMVASGAMKMVVVTPQVMAVEL